MQTFWRDVLKIGFDDIDDQHKVLVGYLDKMVAAKANDAEEVKAVLTGLEEYVNYHFSYEEAKLAAAGFVKLEEHKKEHKNFALAVQAKVSEYQNSNYDVDEMVTFLKEWLVKHIMVKDRIWAKYLLEQAKN
ncbi:MAG: bacteriohemerythrin [Spirochaetaceae bacterium]|nr:bacteriohemerythrin [Spirochaetaceae bacterium]